jgi:uncharacterized protein (UPF0218 family)
MPKKFTITPEVTAEFKEPFGKMIRGSSTQTICKLKELLKTENPRMIIAVGDTVSRNLSKNQIPTHLSITDNRSHRRKTQPQTFKNKELIKVKNPQGTITFEAIEAIQTAIKDKNEVHLLVDGEEDLLTLAAVLYAPENSLVIYGQPHKGIVVIKVAPEKKLEAERILNKMEKTE